MINSLGVTDYGLYCVVGSIIVFITFLNGAMANSASRYFAYSLGRDDFIEVNYWFNAALGIHILLPVLLIIIGWPVGEYVVGHALTIPDNRVGTSILIFRISLVSAFVSMASVPFVAMFTAKQRIAELAAWGMLQAILAFALAWFIRYASGDRLLFYAAGMVWIITLVQAAQVLRARTLFKECAINYRQWFDRQKCKALFSFASWNLFGAAGSVLRDQGSAIILNLFFGPGMNAAYGIASQVSCQTNQLSNAMLGAFSPEITAREGGGERASMLSLSQRASKFGTLLVLLLAIPLMAEMNYILKLWLHIPPPNTALFCQLILGTFLIERLSTGYMLAVQAHGKIVAYQATVGLSLLLTLPLAWLFLKIGFAPTSIGVAFIATMTVTSLGRVFWGRHFFGIPVFQWFTAVVWPSSVVALAATVAALVPRELLSPSFMRLVLVTASSVAAALFSAWFIALDRCEREFAGQVVQRAWKEIYKKI